jgi:hypothetical protein
MDRVRAWNRNRSRLTRARRKALTGGELAAGVRRGSLRPHPVGRSATWRTCVAEQICGYVAMVALWRRPGLLMTLQAWARLLVGPKGAGEGVSERTVQRALAELEGAGWILVHHRFPAMRGQSQAANLVEAGPVLLGLLGLPGIAVDPSESSYPSPETLSRVDTEIDTPGVAGASCGQPAIPLAVPPAVPTAAGDATEHESPSAAPAAVGAGYGRHRALAAGLSASARNPEAPDGGGSDRRSFGGGRPVTASELEAMRAEAQAWLRRAEGAPPAKGQGRPSPAVRHGGAA